MALTLFGLTGGVAAGKSTVAARVRELGVPVVDADAIARDVVAVGSEGLGAVRAAFGDDVLRPDGSLDRARLGALVFADAAARARLEAITHPRIRSETVRQARELDAAGELLACYEAALLVENGLADALRPLVVVAVPEVVQLARLAARDGLSAEQGQQRLAAQLPLAAKLAAADFVIDGTLPLDAMRGRVDEVIAAIQGGLAAGRWAGGPRLG